MARFKAKHSVKPRDYEPRIPGGRFYFDGVNRVDVGGRLIDSDGGGGMRSTSGRPVMMPPLWPKTFPGLKVPGGHVPLVDNRSFTEKVFNPNRLLTGQRGMSYEGEPEDMIPKMGLGTPIGRVYSRRRRDA